MRTTQISWDVTRVLFAVVAIGGLIAASFWIVRPFLPATIWAVMIVVATWPEMRWIDQKLGNRRGIAVTIMTAAMLAIILVPVAIAVTTLIDRADEIARWTKSMSHFSVPPPPAWLLSLPLVGARLGARWQEVAAMQPLALAALLYAQGEPAAEWVIAFARRLAGGQGERAVRLSGQAIRAIALGIVVTALVQSIVGGIGLVIAGVPHATILTAVIFLLGVAQIGAVPVMVGAVIWLFWQDQ